MFTIITILSVITIFLLIFKYEWGLGAFILYYCLVPVFDIYIGGFTIGRNLFFLFIFGLFFVQLAKCSELKPNYSLLAPFFFLFVAEAFLIFLHISNEPLLYQFEMFRTDLMNLLVPFTIINTTLINKKTVKVFNFAIYTSIVIAGLYGLFLITMPGQNPYIEALGSLTDFDLVDQETALEENVRIFGYISSCYLTVTQYGEFLMFVSVFLLYKIRKENTIAPKILYGLVLLDVLFCGSRSVLLGEASIVLAYLLFNRRFKLFFGVGAGLLVFWNILLYFLPDYMYFIMSITDDSLATGSSIDMRLGQLKGCFDSIKNNPLFGNGYNWTGWYRTYVGRHPVMLSFESCLIQILCNNGVVGLLIWAMMAVSAIKAIKLYFPGNPDIKKYVLLLIISYFAYTFFTGDYGAFRRMILFYAILVSNEIMYQYSEKNDRLLVNA